MTRSLSFQILSGFVLLASLLTVLLVLNNGYAMNVVRSQIADANRLLLTSNVMELENRFSEVNANLYSFTQDPDFQLLRYNPDEADKYFTMQRIISKFRLIISRRTDAYFVYKISTGSLILVTSEGLNQFPIMDTIRDVVKESKPNIEKWFPVIVKNRSYMFRLVPYQNELVIGAAISAERLTENIPVWDPGKNQGVNLITDDWKLFNDTGYPAADIEQIKKTGIKPDIFQTVGDAAGKAPFQLVGQHMNEALLSVVYTIPEKQLLANLPNFQRVINVLPWLTVLLIIFYILYMQQLVLKPTKRLIKGMHRVKKGQLDIRLPEKTITREFTTLNVTFNQMAAEIHDLKLEAYEKQLVAQEARFKHLQAQINPHFFMNALNISYSLAGLREYQLVQKLLAHIVDFLRFITRNTGDQVTLEQELDHIRNYLEIQKLRFPNRVDYEYAIEDGLKFYPIPPLTVQPIVENAIIHGFKQESGVFVISIGIRVVGEKRLEIVVRDNGVGFSDEFLQAWNGGAELAGTHIGIRNVMERLAIKFGNDAELAFENDPDGGAIVRLRLPYSERPAKGDN